MKSSYRKKKIAILTGRIMGKGGTETVLSTLGNNSELNKIFDFDIFITEHLSNKDLFDFLNTLKLVRKIKIDKSVNRIWRNISIVLYLIITQADIVIGMKPRYIQIAAKIKKYFNKRYKVVSWIHFSLKHMPGSGNSFEKMQLFLPMADAHLAISSGIANELIEIGISSENISIIYNPLSRQESTIYPVKQDGIARFVYVGRLYDEQKNIIGLLNILSTFDINLQLDVFGTGPDEKVIHKVAKQLLDKKSHVVWHGWSQNPWEQIDNADALLLTSNYEGFPMTLLESISRGLPVVSYDCPTGPEDIIKNGENGYLIPIGSQEKFKDGMTKVTNHQKFSDRENVKNTLDFLYGDAYTERFKSAIHNILGILD
ncbi:glycosyltransferase [Leuconostoc pseudomesenteroides]|uniref:glycosyltransferase n=1 Tax=Leuconostoc pseudomesenteroides TaxID=33968 RepID=UPI001B8ADCBA|nr:glycosyltransferase [Leuconostoc pseudomesenteroides]MBS0958847.1 glycosyltransferase [Leuconostoc pseudomesenteroides]